MADDLDSDGALAELRDVAARVRGLEEALSNQRSAFIDIAGARSAELRSGLNEVASVVGALRAEVVELQELQKAVRGRIYDLVAEAVQPELRALLGQRFPQLVIDALGPDLRRSLQEWLPTFMVDAVRPEVRASLDERLPAVVTEAVSPEVRRAIADRLPSLVTEAVRPEVRATITERLPAVIAQVVSPEVAALLSERLPGMLSEILIPELAESLTEIEASAAELRGESARMRALREVVTEQLPQAVLTTVEPHLAQALGQRIPELIAAAVEPTLKTSMARDLPRLLAEAMGPDLAPRLAEAAPGALADAVKAELTRATAETIAIALPGAVRGAIEPELRENLQGALPMAVAETVVAALSAMIAEQLPGQLTDLVLPQMAVSLTEVERNAAELRHETAQLRNLREGIADRMPEAVVNSVQPIFEDLLAVRLPAVIGETVGPAVREVLAGRLAELVQAAVQDEVGYVLREIAGQHDEGGPDPAAEATNLALSSLTRELAEVRGQQSRLHLALPDMIATAVSVALRSTPPPRPAGPEQPIPYDQDLPGVAHRSPGPAPSTPSAPTRPPPPAGIDRGPAVDIAHPRPFDPVEPVEPVDPVDPVDSAATGDDLAAPDEADFDVPTEAAMSGDVPAGDETEALPAKRTGGRDTAPVLPEPVEGEDLIRDLGGLVTGPALALGVATELRRARVRRRRRRQAGPPMAALHRRDPHSDRLTRDLERYALASRDYPRRSDEHIGVVALGVDHASDGTDSEVLWDFAHDSLAIVGTGARDVARAAVLSILSSGRPDQVEVVTVGGLVPTGTDFPGLVRAPDDRAAVSRLRDELAERRRTFQRDGDAGLDEHRRRHPEDALPLVVLASADLSPERVAEVARLVGDAAGLGLTVLLADSTADSVPGLELGPDGSTTAGGTAVAEGTRYYSATREAAGILLGVVAAGRTERADEEVAPAVEDPFQGAATEGAAVTVELLGTYRIKVADREIRSGLRAKARELLAFYLLHPEGTTLEEATEALWPEADPRRGSEWFWTALGNLRSRLRQAIGDSDLKVIEREGDLYRIEGLFDVDLWRFVDHLGKAASISGEPTWPAALERAAESYTGDLVSGADWAWVEIPRQELRDRQVDVLVSLAATRLVGGNVKEALDALQQAVEVDPLAEQLYRRIMRLQARLRRDDQVEATFGALVARLAEVALEPSADSVELHRELTAG